jgi:hypothetical protein
VRSSPWNRKTAQLAWLTVVGGGAGGSVAGGAVGGGAVTGGAVTGAAVAGGAVGGAKVGAAVAGGLVAAVASCGDGGRVTAAVGETPDGRAVVGAARRVVAGTEPRRGGAPAATDRLGAALRREARATAAVAFVATVGIG